MYFTSKQIYHSEKNKGQKLSLDDQKYIDQYFESRNDKEIWDMFRDGHVGAFRFIYIQHFNLIFAYGCRITENSELVKDCIQDLFIELWKSRNISGTKSIKFYLFRALRWKIYRKLEQRKRFLQMDEDNSRFKMDFDQPYETILIQDQTSEIDKMKLNNAISKLSSRQKEALYYFYSQNMDYTQVADIMNFSNVKSARNIIYKAIAQLRKAM